MRERLRSWANAVKLDVLAVWLAARDPRVPGLVKVLAAVVAAYALSPIDLIPDFIPILGYVDDLILVPAGLWLVIKLIPAGVMAELRAQAADMTTRRPKSWTAAAVIVLIWLVAVALLARLFHDPAW